MEILAICIFCVFLLVLTLAWAVRSHPEKEPYDAISDFGDEMARSLASYLPFGESKHDYFNDALDDLDSDVEDINALEDGVAGDALIDQVIDEELLQYIDRENYPCWTPPKDVPTLASAAGVKSCGPSFIIAGGMKCGTTSMYQYLTQHPAVLHITGDYLFPNSAREKLKRELKYMARLETGDERGVPRSHRENPPWNEGERPRRPRVRDRSKPHPDKIDRFVNRLWDLPEQDRTAILDRLNKLQEANQNSQEETDQSVLRKDSSNEIAEKTGTGDSDRSDDTAIEQVSADWREQSREKQRMKSKREARESDLRGDKDDRQWEESTAESLKKKRVLKRVAKPIPSQSNEVVSQEDAASEVETEEQKTLVESGEISSGDGISETEGGEETQESTQEESTGNSDDQVSADLREQSKEKQRMKSKREARESDLRSDKDDRQQEEPSAKSLKKKQIPKRAPKAIEVLPNLAEQSRWKQRMKSKRGALDSDMRSEKNDRQSLRTKRALKRAAKSNPEHSDQVVQKKRRKHVNFNRDSADSTTAERRLLGWFNESSTGSWRGCYDEDEGCKQFMEDGLCETAIEKVSRICRRTCEFCGNISGRDYWSGGTDEEYVSYHNGIIVVRDWGYCYDLYGDPIPFTAETISELLSGERLCWSEMTNHFIVEQVPLLKRILNVTKESRRRLVAKERPDLSKRRKKRGQEKKRFLRPIIGQKEVRFFDRMWYSEALSLAGSTELAFGWYLNVFPIIPAPGEPANAWDSARGKITGEASPTYLNKPSTAITISSHLPEIKIIFLLRNPVDRVYSARNMVDEIREAVGRFNKQHGKESKGREPPLAGQTPTFDELVYYSSAGPGNRKDRQKPKHIYMYHIKKMERTLNQSIYYGQLEPWTRTFNKDQLMFIRSEDFYENEIRTMHRVEDFLGIKRLPDKLWEPIVDEVYNLHIDPKTKEFKPVPQHLDIGQDLHTDDDERMTKETRQLLKKFYKSHNKRLEKLLSPWRFKVWS